MWMMDGSDSFLSMIAATPRLGELLQRLSFLTLAMFSRVWVDVKHGTYEMTVAGLNQKHVMETRRKLGVHSTLRASRVRHTRELSTAPPHAARIKQIPRKC